jgi:hypothetical protein
VREGKTRGIGEAAWHAVDNLGNQGERLERARPELFQHKKFGEVVQITFVRDGEYGSETLQVNILRADFVMIRQAQVARRV